MGCGNSNTNSPKITSITANNLHEIGLDLKDSLILFFSKKSSLNVNIGIYTDLIYHKKKSSDKIIKYKNKKFFLKNSKKKVINNSIIKKYYEIYPKNIKYSSIGIDDKFSPNFLLNNNFEKLFENLKINEKKFAITFINNKYKNTKEYNKLKEIKNKFGELFYIYINDNINDEIYFPYEMKTIFFEENEINFWIDNDDITSDNFEQYINYISTDDEYENIIENYIKENNNNNNKEFIIKYKYYEIFNKTGNIINTKYFPIIIKSYNNKNNEDDIINNKNIIYITIDKNNNYEYLISLIKSNFNNIEISQLEIFKEKITSFLLGNNFTIKKRYTLYLKPINKDLLFSLKNYIENNINKIKENINNNILIENIIIKPELNTKFFLYEEDKYIYIIMRHSNCFNFAKTLLKKKYKDIFGNNFIKFICIKNDDKEANIDSETNNNNNIILISHDDDDNESIKINNYKSNDDILYINENLLINNNTNNYDLLIYSFSDINYFSHILLITNELGEINYINFFKNRNQIYTEYLKKNDIKIKTELNLIKNEDFQKIKIFYENKKKELFEHLKIIKQKNNNIINITEEESYFDNNYYKNNIFYQPYLSLKYNKIINLDNNNKSYKNYALNYMNIENFMDIEFDKDNEYKALNEICYIYKEQDKYIELKKDLRCKLCYNKVSNNEGILKDKYIFYICPISKDIICQNCYLSNKKYEESYPYNLLYIKCKNKLIFSHLLKENISLFKERINYKIHNEILDEKCDICNNDLCVSEHKKETFYILERIIKKNYFLICEKCFEILISDDKDWIMDSKFNYINNFIFYFFVDLDNLIFKIVKFK